MQASNLRGTRPQTPPEPPPRPTPNDGQPGGRIAPRHRLYLVVCSTLVVGSIVAHLAYAWYLRSDAFRGLATRKLSEFFNLPADIQTVVPRTYSSRAFDGVELWLPDRRDRIFRCDRALWSERRANGRLRVDLDLSRGTLALGTDRWLLEDYRRVLESGLRHDFDEIDQVRLDDFSMTFRRADVLLSAEKVRGTLIFQTPDLGIASLEAYVFNGQPVREPVRIHARFLPHGEVLVETMSLAIPEVALAGLGLEKAVGGPISRGWFAGRLEYAEAKPRPSLVVSGRLFDVDLSELTQRVPSGPIRGSAEVFLERAEMVGSLPTHVKGHAAITGVQLVDLARWLRLPALAGAVELNVSEIDILEGVIRRLVNNGRVRDVELADALRLLGRGEATGRVTVTINALRIESNRIVSADIDVAAAPPAGVSGTIDRELLLTAAKHLAGFSLPEWIDPQWLPTKVEYTRFGLRLLVTDNRLRIIGTHGHDGDTILTIRVLGREWGVVKEWGGEIDLTPWVEELLGRISAVDPREVPKMLRRQAEGE